MPELSVHPEELMMIAPVSVGGVHWTGIFCTRWWYGMPNSSGRYICALRPKGYEREADSHQWVNDHLLRIRQWLRDNPEDDEIKQLAPVDRHFPRDRRLWEAVLATWNREQVAMATDVYGPLGCFNDDTPGTPFTKKRCKEINREESERRFGSGGSVVTGGAS